MLGDKRFIRTLHLPDSGPIRLRIEMILRTFLRKMSLLNSKQLAVIVGKAAIAKAAILFLY